MRIPFKESRIPTTPTGKLILIIMTHPSVEERFLAEFADGRTMEDIDFWSMEEIRPSEVLAFILQELSTQQARLKEAVEGKLKGVNHCQCKQVPCEIHTLSRTVAYERIGYNQAIRDVLSLLSPFKKEL